ncbi:DUF1963 domain-containing protein [Streptomyces lincolnensis]|uniref:DUF1963 domain-containing protein n=1 Tax=Streptomyces lincolnensis TaxID=1915 RepID=UPI0037D8154A
MTPEETRGRLGPFRDKALARGIPVDEVERWMDTARPCAILAKDGDGPVVGRFGGPLLLPVGTPHPSQPFVASLDLAALPADATDLPLPADGRLLLFAYPEDEGGGADMGHVLYIPAGTAVTERDKNAWSLYEIDEYREVFERFPEEPLRATTEVSLPYHHLVELPEPPYADVLPGHPHAEELAEVWDETYDDIAVSGPLQLGGYASQEAVDVDPVATAVARVTGRARPAWDEVAGWVLLADWSPGITGQEGATVHWVIRREDLAARRFDRAFTSVFWNP